MSAMRGPDHLVSDLLVIALLGGGVLVAGCMYCAIGGLVFMVEAVRWAFRTIRGRA